MKAYDVYYAMHDVTSCVVHNAHLKLTMANSMMKSVDVILRKHDMIDEISKTTRRSNKYGIAHSGVRDRFKSSATWLRCLLN